MIDDTLFEAEEKMDKAVTVAMEDFSHIRTGRVHPGIFSKVTAEYYGTQTSLDQLASFHVLEPRMITVKPHDKSSLASIEKAIRNSDLGVNPSNDGVLIRVIFPELTEERREEIRIHLDFCGPCNGAAEFEAELRRVIASRCRDRVPYSLIRRVAEAIDDKFRDFWHELDGDLDVPSKLAEIR